MAEQPARSSEGPRVETYTYSAGSYDRVKTNEEELFELVKLSEVPIDKELFKVILELLKLNVAPAAILQVLKSLKSQNTPDDLESRSPMPQQRADSKQPLTSDPFPTAPPITGASLDGGRGVKSTSGRGAEKKQSERSEHGKEGHHRHKKASSSSDRHQSKHRVKGHGSRHDGSSKHKTREPSLT